MSGRFRTLDNLPLFASEEAIAAAVLGPGKTVEWRGIVRLLENRGFPRIDGLHGGWYVPAIRAFYDAEYCVKQDALPAQELHRPAELVTWKSLRRRKQSE